MYYYFCLLLISILALPIAGCSSAPLRIEPVAEQNQSVSYHRGQPQLTSSTNHLLGLTIVDYSDDTMVISVSVTNTGDEPFNFSESNVTGQLISIDGTLPVDVFLYEAMVEELDIKDYETIKQAGWASVSAGSAFVPFGGIAVSAAKLLLSAGQTGGESDKERIDTLLTASQFKQIYLRRHTVMPGAKYGGLLKISYPDEIEDGYSLVFTVSADQKAGKFTFLCKR